MDSYNKVVWCTEVSPCDEEYFKQLKQEGVKAAVINLTIGLNSYNSLAKEQYRLAKEHGMITHLFHLAMFEHLEDILKEAEWFSSLAGKFHQEEDTVMTVLFNPEYDVKNATAMIDIFLNEMRQFGNEYLDICVPARLIQSGNLSPMHLSYKANFTLIDCNRMTPSIAGCGTWIYANKFKNQPQLIAYDFFDFYVKPNRLRGVQISLFDTYVAKPGDNWWLVAERLGVPIVQLLALNDAELDDKVYPGDHIKVA